jgi:hypothetical protein
MGMLAGGSVVRSIQRGTAATSTGTVNVTISWVNVAKSVVNFAGDKYGTSMFSGMLANLDSPTNIAFDAGDSGVLKYFSWEVVEYF